MYLRVRIAKIETLGERSRLTPHLKGLLCPFPKKRVSFSYLTLCVFFCTRSYYFCCFWLALVRSVLHYTHPPPVLNLWNHFTVSSSSENFFFLLSSNRRINCRQERATTDSQKMGSGAGTFLKVLAQNFDILAGYYFLSFFLTLPIPIPIYVYD